MTDYPLLPPDFSWVKLENGDMLARTERRGVAIISNLPEMKDEEDYDGLFYASFLDDSDDGSIYHPSILAPPVPGFGTQQEA